MDADLGPNGVYASRQLCVVSCQSADVAYYWSVIDGRERNSVGFRGFSATFPAAGPAREVLDFTVQGPLIALLSDLQDIAQVQAIQMGGSAGTPAQQVPFDAQILVAPAPQLAPHGRNPHGVVLRVRNETEGTTIATVANLHRGDDWVFATIAAAIPAVAVNGGGALTDTVVRGSTSAATIRVRITTPMGTVTVVNDFTTVAVLAGLDG